MAFPMFFSHVFHPCCSDHFASWSTAGSGHQRDALWTWCRNSARCQPAAGHLWGQGRSHETSSCCIIMWIYVCMCIYIYMFTHITHITHITYITYIYIHIHTYTYIHIHTYTYIHIHTHTYIHIHTYTYIYIHIHTYTYIYIHIHTYTYIYIHIHTYTYIYIHIHTYTSRRVVYRTRVFNVCSVRHWFYTTNHSGFASLSKFNFLKKYARTFSLDM